MPMIKERTAVWFDNRTKRAVVKEVEGPLAYLVGPNMQMLVRPLDQLEKLPSYVCFICGDAQSNTEAEQQRAEAASITHFGELPPEERRMGICCKCVPVIAALDTQSETCLCAHRQGTIPECVCAARRAGYQKLQEKHD